MTFFGRSLLYGSNILHFALMTEVTFGGLSYVASKIKIISWRFVGNLLLTIKYSTNNENAVLKYRKSSPVHLLRSPWLLLQLACSFYTFHAHPPHLTYISHKMLQVGLAFFLKGGYFLWSKGGDFVCSKI